MSGVLNIGELKFINVDPATLNAHLASIFRSGVATIGRIEIVESDDEITAEWLIARLGPEYDGRIFVG